MDVQLSLVFLGTVMVAVVVLCAAILTPDHLGPEKHGGLITIEPSYEPKPPAFQYQFCY